MPSCPSITKLICASALACYVRTTVPSSHCLRGDGEIRTHDPLLARQVLSQLSYTPINPGLHLLSHFVSKAVPSAVQGLTIVFGMRTGVSPGRISTKNYCCVKFFFRSTTNICFANVAASRLLRNHDILNNKTVQPTSLLFPLERR